ncbi:flagellar hook-length control protein FliK [Sphingomonas gei]|uniref:Flagellar hook-length control protein FliK n=1 Tax=Sphingomonas gei TaxID=1395960 RepID=A0A4S1XAS6_9SPHN|nr:flagellar hook-length control protein FliK [Sphingomonas gei]TGX53211.1 flagellar hook-length control protein FliK [Sphingomonas gei]
MIQLTFLPASPHGPVRPALLGPAGTSSFALALGTLALSPTAKGEGLLPERQMLAEAGKDLPDPVPVAAEDDDSEDTPDRAEIAFAWFAISPTPNPAIPQGIAASTVGIAARMRAEDGGAAALPDLDPAAPRPSDSASGSAAPNAPAAKTGIVPLAAMPAAPAAAPVFTDRVDVPTAQAGDTPQLALAKAAQDHPGAAPAASAAPADPDAIAAKAATLPGRVDQPVRTTGSEFQPTPQPAGQAPTPEASRAAVPNTPALPPLAPAIETAILASGPAILPPARRAPAIELAALALAPSAADALRPHAVTAAGDVQQSAIDMRRQEWVGKMVDQIEALRDAAPVRETRLSLAPEALGKVEVSIRHEGDRVHVHFATETQAARQLIADAQPRLGELAEARGIKLGQTSFESGTAGQGPNRDTRDHSGAQQSRQPRPANSDSPVGTADDDRIA